MKRSDDFLRHSHDSYSPAEAEQKLRSIIAEIDAEIAQNDEPFRSLYNDPSCLVRPVPLSGRVPSARYLTISPNPSADDLGSPPMDCDLAQHCLDYFHHATLKPHHFYPDWESGLGALFPSRLSYSSDLAHVDVSPRPTRSLTAINKSDAAIKLFLQMVGLDIKYLFQILAVAWPNLRGLFAAGTVTKKKYIDKILCQYGPRLGFQFSCIHVFPAAAAAEDSHPRLYQVSYKGRSKPLFFCPVGPSARRPGEKKLFLAQFRDNATYLRPMFCPDVVSQSDSTDSLPK
jgi:hypothetical protein